MGGYGEGLIMVTPVHGENSKILKWKVGAESTLNHKANLEILDRAFEMMDNDTEGNIFKENTDKAREIFTKMKEVNLSKLVCGKEVKKEDKKAKASLELTEDEKVLYEEAIKSAKTKFDHQDDFFN